MLNIRHYVVIYILGTRSCLYEWGGGVCATYIACVSAGCAALQLCVGPALAMQSLSRLAESCGSILGNICEFTTRGACKLHVSYESH